MPTVDSVVDIQREDDTAGMQFGQPDQKGIVHVPARQVMATCSQVIHNAPSLDFRGFGLCLGPPCPDFMRWE
ncbi:MAG: hypothetical protein WCO71_12550 [Pseudomonadota bacterium]